MEEQILTIIFKHMNNLVESTPDYNTAKEITAHVMEFIHWIIDEQEIFKGELSEKYIINENLASPSLEDIYQYWLTNIKEK